VALGKSVMVGRILLSSVVRISPNKQSEIFAVRDHTMYSVDNRQTPELYVPELLRRFLSRV